MAWPAQQAFPVDTCADTTHAACSWPLTSLFFFCCWLCCKTCADPDTKHTPSMPIDCLKSSNYGEQWRNSIRGFFHERIRNGHITIFDREVAMPRV